MISRRTLLKAFVVAPILFRPRHASSARTKTDGFLSLRNIHTEETLDTTYRDGGEYDADALRAIDRLLRCHYTNEVRPIDVGVLDLLCGVKDRCGGGVRIDVVSGYRSPTYNALLRRQGRGVAGGSYHLCGFAIDFALPGVPMPELFRAAKSFSSGGVGLYREFVHIDVGPVRYWSQGK